MISWVSNGGYAYDLTLIRAEEPPEPTEKIDVSQKTLDVIIKALAGVVADENGTGRNARSKSKIPTA